MNAIQTTNTALLPVAEVRSIAEAFAASGMFPDTKTAAQAIVKVQAGQEMGIPPFQAMTGIHIISGKPTVGAGIMASRVKASGKYDYKVREQTDTICKIEFFELSYRDAGWASLGMSTFTIEEARKAGTKNLDRFPKNMLFARAMSNGVKWFTPDVFFGPVYVPEEFDTEQAPITQDISHEVLSNPVLGASSLEASAPSKSENQTVEVDVVSPLEYYAAEVHKCQDKAHLDRFFNTNLEDIGGDQQIIDLFTARQFQFTYSLDDLTKMLPLTRSIQQVTDLFYANRDEVDKNPILKRAFSVQKEEIKEALAAQSAEEASKG
ncbi:MAG: hypothetical protein EOP52_12435 [Sphingobacteriales bacterium]|nr:MAG: hypothetical protein EOP52_12435 [Sphingobacteriales bacterium]